jgi:glucan phosphoethanolaminetransferase (alkaline phosphatase superfamily)
MFLKKEWQNILSKDLKSKQVIYLKAIFFVLILLLSMVLNLISDELSLRIVSIVFIVWSSARIYYFMFYVIEYYVDGEFHFSGIYDFLKYIFSGKKCE